MSQQTIDLLKQANACKTIMWSLTATQKAEIINTMADCLLAQTEEILQANALDVDAAKEHISAVMIDRLTLTKERIADMASGMRSVADLDDPTGRVLSTHSLPNGLVVEKTSTALGLIAIIYESRPNVTSDAGCLAFKSGNVCVLRGGKESYRSNAAIVSALQMGLKQHNLPVELISLVHDTSRDSAKTLMTARGLVDLLIPRGGASLIQTCVNEATVPCIETGTGICHIYVDQSADIEKALSIIENAKTSRPSVCNAMEVCLIHEDLAPTFLSQLKDRLVTKRENAGHIPVELRLDESALSTIEGTKASDTDFDTEFLDYILAIKIVSNTQDAIAHINTHSSGHSDAIIAENVESQTLFSRTIDSAAVYINASTRFTDGGEFGLGCEMGISTQKLHARGPMGLQELTSYKYIIRGNGQIR